MDWSRLVRRRALTAAATIISADPAAATGRASALLGNAAEWQNECWGYFDTLGMYRNAVMWKADMLSRVRLRAAKKEPGNDEPTILDEGRAAELVAELSASSQSEIMSRLAVYLGVPGEGYLVGETVAGVNRWSARSADEVRIKRSASARAGTTSPWEVIDENQPGNTNRWRPLPPDSLVVRVWRPHPRWYNIADSNSRAALDTMRELELANRRIATQYISRLASCGVIIFPNGVTFPTRPEFANAARPFVEEWIEMAAQAIKTPGAAAAAIPMPVQMEGEFIKDVRYIDFTSKLDTRDIEKRDSAVKQLAIDLDVPPEALIGMSEANHWTGWLIEESGFKIYLAPDTETICGALTEGYLYPRLAAEGEDLDDLLVWYDASEITQRPDKSQHTLDAYDRGAASAVALRRELGLDEDDAPTRDDLAAMILWTLASNPATAASALRKLTGVVLGETVAPGGGGPAEAPTEAPAASGSADKPPPAEKQQGPPEQPAGPPAERPPNEPPARAAAIAELTALAHLGTLPHAIKFDSTGHRVWHPAECDRALQRCPMTHATWADRLRARPGAPGIYTLTLDGNGTVLLGQRLYDADLAAMRAGSHVKANGVMRR